MYSVRKRRLASPVSESVMLAWASSWFAFSSWSWRWDSSCVLSWTRDSSTRAYSASRSNFRCWMRTSPRTPPERVVTGIEVRIGGAAAAAEGDPFGVEALELVGEAVALGGGEVQGRELDAEDLVPEAERDLTDLVGGAAQGAVPDAHRREHHRRRLAHAAQPVRHERVEAVDAPEEKLPARALVPRAEVELAGLEAVAHAVVGELAGARIEARQAAVRAQPQPAVAVAPDAVDHVAREPVPGRERLEGRRSRGPVIEAAVRPDPEPARGVHEKGVDRVRGQAGRVSRPVLEPLEATGPRVEQVEPLFHRAHPQPAVGRLREARGPVSAQAGAVVRVVTVVREALGLGIELLQPAAVGREPEQAVAVLEDARHAVGAEPLGMLRGAAITLERSRAD